VAVLLLILVLAGLAYVAWRVIRANAGRAKTRVIGPDDDPEFLRRLGHGDSNPRP
jgi:3-dehydroquinate synthase class II